MINFLKKLVNSLYFIRIAISPFLIGLIAGGILYFYLDKSKMGLFLFEILSLIGLSAGIYLAVFITKKNKLDSFFTPTDSDENENEL